MTVDISEILENLEIIKDRKDNYDFSDEGDNLSDLMYETEGNDVYDD